MSLAVNEMTLDELAVDEMAVDDLTLHRNGQQCQSALSFRAAAVLPGLAVLFPGFEEQKKFKFTSLGNLICIFIVLTEDMNFSFGQIYLINISFLFFSAIS